MKKVAAVLAVLLILGSTVAACWLVNVWHESDMQKTKIVKLRKMSEKAPATDLKGRKAVAERSALPQSDTAVRDFDEPILHSKIATTANTTSEISSTDPPLSTMAKLFNLRK